VASQLVTGLGLELAAWLSTALLDAGAELREAAVGSAQSCAVEKMVEAVEENVEAVVVAVRFLTGSDIAANCPEFEPGCLERSRGRSRRRAATGSGMTWPWA